MQKRQFADFYRPKLLTQVVGQEHAVMQIRTMLEKNSIPNCILIDGPTGSCKTTLARILGNSIVNPDYAGKLHPDYHEEELGTDRGIDAVRAITNRARFAPQTGRYSVFVLDEIAKATPQAFSPLLKILEEPPPQTVFILITDEPERLPKTILGRCYRIHLSRLAPVDLRKIIKRVMRWEKIKFPSKKVVQYIAKNAEEPRTALQMLQQARDAGGDLKAIMQVLRQTPTGAEQMAVKLLYGLYANKPKLVFPILLAPPPDHVAFLNNLLRYNEWIMLNFFPTSVYVWHNSFTDMLQKYLKDGPPKLDRLTHTHNVLVNLRGLLVTVSSFEQRHAILARLGSLVFTV